MIGKRIAHYEVIEKIGAGGMGEVFRAKDTKLGRDVALKVLPDTFALDAERLSRFDREAKLLAALNHANIAAIYGTEESGGRHVLVLEFVAGDDLQQRLTRGAIPVDDALPIAYQIAEALEAAHDQGVIHRDLKPANVKVTPDGVVKVLDFGLAKALDASDDADIMSSPTMLMSSPTVQGVILGTAAYMSPEQARGKRVDRRADIFAFGCLLYEMLTAQRCFGGETISDTLASVLKEQPDLGVLPGGTPTPIKRLIERCLDKNPRLRLRDIGEARILIDQIVRGVAIESPGATAPPAKRSGIERIGWAAAALVIGAVALFAGKSMQPEIPEPPLRKFSIPVSNEDGTPRMPIVSPDGERVAYRQGNTIYIRNLGELQTTKLVEMAGRSNAPFWSPDGTHLGFFSEGTIWKIAVAGGGSTMICNPQVPLSIGTGGTWTDDGRVIFGTGDTGILQVSAQGGEKSTLIELEDDERDHHEPATLPGNAGVLYVSHRAQGEADRVMLFAGGERSVVVEVPSVRLGAPSYVNSGHVIYHREGTNGGVWALSFSLENLEPTGEPFLVAAGARRASVSRDGTLVYLLGGQQNNRVLRFVSRDGDFGESLTDPGTGTFYPSISPDGERVVYAETDGDDSQLWITDIPRRSRTRFTFEKGAELFCYWDPSGDYIYYWAATPDSIYRRRSDGTGGPEPMLKGGHSHISPDNRYIVYVFVNDVTQQDLFYAALEDLQPHPLLLLPGRQEEPQFSPDGNYVLYESDQSGVDDIFITRFPSGQGKWQVSEGGALASLWGPDGDIIYYTTADASIYGVEVETTPTIRLARPELLYDATVIRLPRTNARYFTQLPGDKNRLLMASVLGQSVSETNTDLTVVENWFKEFATK